MMFYADALRVVLATVHIPLAEVSARADPRDARGHRSTSPRASCRDSDSPSPRLALAGLNPHAGEHGLIGREDDEVLAPAVGRVPARGIDVDGPFPADTVFVRAMRGEFDAVIACYHDQGLIPVKLVAFGHAVNVTLGLPIIRTSVDHGTAFDIAGKGIADPSSMIEAVKLAAPPGSEVRNVERVCREPYGKNRARTGAEEHRREPQGVSRLPHPRDLRGRRGAARAPR